MMLSEGWQVPIVEHCGNTYGIPMDKQVSRGRCSCSRLPLVQRSEGYVNGFCQQGQQKCPVKSQKMFYLRVPQFRCAMPWFSIGYNIYNLVQWCLLIVIACLWQLMRPRWEVQSLRVASNTPAPSARSRKSWFLSPPRANDAGWRLFEGSFEDSDVDGLQLTGYAGSGKLGKTYVVQLFKEEASSMARVWPYMASLKETSPSRRVAQGACCRPWRGGAGRKGPRESTRTIHMPHPRTFPDMAEPVIIHFKWDVP